MSVVLHRFSISILGAISIFILMNLVSSGYSQTISQNKSKNYPFDCIADQFNPCPDAVELKDIIIGKLPPAGQTPPRTTLTAEFPSPNVPGADGSTITTKLKLINRTSNNFYWRLGQLVGSTAYLWPANSAYYTKAYGSSQVSIGCVRNYTVYIGGSATNGAYFCYGVYFNLSGSGTCSAICNGATYTLTVY